MSTFQYSLIHPEICDPFSWMNEFTGNVKDEYISSDEEPNFSDLYYVKQLGSLNLDSQDNEDLYDLPSPIPLLRMTATNEYCPSFKVQMETIYGLKKGKKYSFVENYSLLYSISNKRKYKNKTKKTIGVFDEYVDTNIFRFLVNDVPYLVNRRNFETKIRGYNVDFQELREPTVPLKPLP